jgi:hypothetical protein
MCAQRAEYILIYVATGTTLAAMYTDQNPTQTSLDLAEEESQMDKPNFKWDEAKRHLIHSDKRIPDMHKSTMKSGLQIRYQLGKNVKVTHRI